METSRSEIAVEGRDCSGCGKVSLHFSVGVETGLFEDEEILHGNLLTFQADDLGDGDDFARAIREARFMDDEVDGGSNLFSDCAGRKFDSAHQHHCFETCDDIARGVGVHGRQGAVVASIHGLEHIEGFAAAAFADDDAVGAHTEGIAHEIADGNGSAAFDIGRSGFKADEVRLCESKFGRVFDGQDSFGMRQVIREDIEECRLTGSGTACDDDIFPKQNADSEKFAHGIGDCAESDQIPVEELSLGEFTDCDAGTVERKGVDDAVDARSVGETGIDVGLGFIDAPTERGDDSFDNGEDGSVVHECLIGQFETTAAFDENLIRTIDHDFRNGIVLEKRFEGTEAERFVEEFLRESVRGEIGREFIPNFPDDCAHGFFGAGMEFFG